MNTAYLREFVLIAQVQGFERAAALLFTTQSSLSKHIKRLEEGLNVALFDRSSRRATLTPAGEALLPLAREMLAQEDRILKEIQTLQPGQRTVLSLGSIANIAAYQLGSLFQRFQEEYPLCYLNLCGGAPQEMHQRLLSGERELVFLRYDQQTDMSAFNIIPFTTDRLVAVCPSTHPFALRDSVTLQDLAGEHIISFAEGSFMHEFIQNAFRREGLTPNIVMSAHRTDNLLYLTGYQMGICLLMRRPALTIRDSRMTLVDIEPPIENHVDLCYRKDRALSEAAQKFITCFLRWKEEAGFGA